MANFHYLYTDGRIEPIFVNVDTVICAIPHPESVTFRTQDTTFRGPAIELYTDSDSFWIVNLTMEQFEALVAK